MAVAGLSNTIALNLCRTLGHDVHSVDASPVFNPNTKEVQPRKEILCVRCGIGLEELRKKRYAATAQGGAEEATDATA